MTTGKENAIIPGFEGRIFSLRGYRVILSADLADLYGVPTKALNQAVKRNIDRFPRAFMFQLTLEEAISSRSQIVTLNKPASEADEEASKRGMNIKYLPFAFTEHGVLMAANVLKSARATSISVRIVEEFIRLRSAVIELPDLAKKITEIEERLSGHDEQFKVFQELVFPLITILPAIRRKAGFDPKGGKGEKR